ncbi:nitroreductase family protein [Aliikangiella coralliicola]|uniref:Putative NAD(P)H nitroreductase n=1 Tax=Aliikangiella coralliicola TaxID=2592383 RepID=A0A545U4M0_9GAMM|nr:nitroreductase [Aliikangiella coralliicola]TQV84427.1 nitroreductase [Aliikangiella coralliicola]
MTPIDLLLSRKSHNKLTSPAPDNDQLEILFKAALRAPDHALLKPARYRVFEGDSLARLGDYFVTAALNKEPELPQEKQDKLRGKPLRAPMVIVASAVLKEHSKVPEVEQILSVGAGVQNMLMAAHFQGIGAMWRTGGMAYNEKLMELLEFEAGEMIIGFIYLGTEEGNKRAAKPLEIEEFVTRFGE